MMEFSESVAVVTGAGSGIGRAVTRRLVEAGFRVHAIGRTRAKLDGTAAECGNNPRLTLHVADVGDPQRVEQLFAEIQQTSGRVDLLVNNAGINVRDRAVAKLSIENWEKLLRVNLSGPFHCIRSALPMMKAQHAGLIINISSVAGVRPLVLGGAGYAAAKAGLNFLSSIVTQEECRQGIRSTVICPGEVETPILDERPEPVSAERRATMLQPDDVAQAVLFVARLPSRAHVPELIIKPTVQQLA